MTKTYSQDTPNFKDQDYIKHEHQIKVTNDVFNGTDTAKYYINKFKKEDDDAYKARLSEASLDNYVFRTVDTIKNIVFRKSIQVETNNQELEKWLDAINFQDNVNEFAKKVLINRVKDGYTWLMVDSPSYDKDTLMSKADLEANNIRPYVNNITRSQVINIDYNDFMMIEQVSIMETYKVKNHRFGYETGQQIRVLEIMDGMVSVSIWRDDKEVFNDLLDLPVIPLIKVGRDDIPPLYDQAIINIKHLNRNSEKSNYVRVGAAPFPLVWGALEDNKKKTLGINSGFVFKGTKNETGFEWAEMSGNNYKMIQEEIKYHEEQMERISVEFVTQLKNATATEVEKASTSNESKLMDYATELEQGLNNAIQVMGYFYDKIKEDDKVIVNKDFNSNIITAEEFNMLMQLRTNGDLSYDRLMEILERGEVLSVLDDKEKETEKTRLRDEI